MPEFNDPGKMLIFLRVGCVVAGLAISLIGKWPSEGGHGSGWLGTLPGDLLITRDRFTVYIPLGVSIFVSVVGSVILYFFMKR